jgi:predicted RNA binding protein YcfA (HicA-like mRNA interferase family)
MAKLRRLSGKDAIRILESFGFEVRRITGSHHHMQLQREDITCRTTVPVHGSKALPTGTLKSIYRQVSRCIPEDDLKPHFYSE